MHNQQDPLTEKEIIIAGHFMRGLSRHEAATAQDCSINTIHSHCRSIFRKKGVKNITSLLKKLREEEEAKKMK